MTARRAALFRETRLAALRRWGLGVAWALRPERIDRLFSIARLSVADLLGQRRRLPDTDALAPDAEIVGFATDRRRQSSWTPTRADCFPTDMFRR